MCFSAFIVLFGNNPLKTSIDQVGDNVFRISIFPENGFITFNHFLVKDEQSALIHMGHRKNFEILLPLVKKILHPDKIRYLTFSHFEPDESGALNEWIEVAPNAEVCVGQVSAASLKDFTDKTPRILKDNESMDLGVEKLLCLETPHFPHNWDACLFYLSESRLLFGSDLGTQVGAKKAFTTTDPCEEIMAFQRKVRYMAYGPHLTSAINKLKALELTSMAAMHGSVLDTSQYHELLSLLEIENQEQLAR